MCVGTLCIQLPNTTKFVVLWAKEQLICMDNTAQKSKMAQANLSNVRWLIAKTIPECHMFGINYLYENYSTRKWKIHGTVYEVRDIENRSRRTRLFRV